MRRLRVVMAGLAAALLSASLVPPATAAASMPAVTAIAAGPYHACAITGAGGLECWGQNIFGQLGDGTMTDRLTPVPVPGLTSGVAAVTAGEMYTCALTVGGAVKCWGNNGDGQLGDGTTTESRVPVDVVGLSSGVRAIVAGWGGHTCALTKRGAVKCWGNNGDGQLGDGTTTESRVPVDVVGLSSGVRAIVAGGFQTCALLNSGGVRCWGYGGDGQLGNGSRLHRTVPVDVVGLVDGVSAIAAGDDYACAVTTGGGVTCWGNNRSGLLWTDATTNSFSPVDVPGLPGGVGAIAAGEYHLCALMRGGHVQCWGANTWGQLGDGTTTNSSIPVAVSGLGGEVTAIATSGFSSYTCAIVRGGVQCWGHNKAGQLGNGTTVSSGVPVDVRFARVASPARSWRSTISGAGLSGTASLAVPPTGWATTTFTLRSLRTGVSVAARIVSGASCDRAPR